MNNSAQNLEQDYRNIPLRSHALLEGIPMHSLHRLELLGGRTGMSILDISDTAGLNTGRLEGVGVLTQALFLIRGLIGWVFHWDNDAALADSVSFLKRLTEEDRERSLISPGQKEAISTVLFCFENEKLAEIVNRTVHCFWVMASVPTAKGYDLYIAVYVKKLNWFTPIYMTIVSPILKWIIYPALNRSIVRNWSSLQKTGRSHMIEVSH